MNTMMTKAIAYAARHAVLLVRVFFGSVVGFEGFEKGEHLGIPTALLIALFILLDTNEGGDSREIFVSRAVRLFVKLAITALTASGLYIDFAASSEWAKLLPHWAVFLLVCSFLYGLEAAIHNRFHPNEVDLVFDTPVDLRGTRSKSFPLVNNGYAPHTFHLGAKDAMTTGSILDNKGKIVGRFGPGLTIVSLAPGLYRLVVASGAPAKQRRKSRLKVTRGAHSHNTAHHQAAGTGHHSSVPLVQAPCLPISGPVAALLPNSVAGSLVIEGLPNAAVLELLEEEKADISTAEPQGQRIH